MPWCPKCKEEYREGITVCADCQVELVDSLEDIEEESQDEALAVEDVEAADAASEDGDYDWDAEMSQEEKAERLAVELEEGMEAEDEEVLSSNNTSYVKKADAYQDLIGTGYTFVILSVLGLIYLLLCQLKVIPIQYNILALIVLVAMFVLFIVIGINSFVKAKAIKELIGSEEEETEAVKEWLREHATLERMEQLRSPEDTEEEYYLMLTERLTEELREIWPDTEEGYLELMVEEYCTEVLGEAQLVEEAETEE